MALAEIWDRRHYLKEIKLREH